MRVYLDSLGCVKNLVDSEATLGFLRDAGLESVAQPGDADIVLINTCGFLEAAREESVHRILELAQLKGEGRTRILAVLGCLVSRAPSELQESLPEVDVWLPAGSHSEIPQRLQDCLRKRPAPELRRAADRSGTERAPLGAFAGFGSRVLLTPQHTAYLKISEGCTNSCSFCSIPLMRGLQRSRPVAELVEEARGLARQNVREIHLVAQDLTHYGFDLPERPDLLDLVRELHGVQGIEWIRLLYAHPKHLTMRMMQGLFEMPKVTRYLDMPVQHASKRILQAMRRPYAPAHVRRQLHWLRENVPGISLRSTVIVGFPGEQEADFKQLCRFVEEVGYDHLGIFAYSREPGTSSYDLPGRVRASTAERRLQSLTELQMHIAAERAGQRIGSEVQLLIDARLEDGVEDPITLPGLARGARFVGRSEAEALDIDGNVFVECDAANATRIRPGSFVRARITAADVYDLRARVVSVDGPGGRVC